MKKEPTSKNAATWGTIQWIQTFPYSRMDRKRRKRAEKAVEKAFPGLLGMWRQRPHTCCVQDALNIVLEQFRISLCRSHLNQLNKALRTVAQFESAIYDEAFGQALKKAWGLPE